MPTSTRRIPFQLFHKTFFHIPLLVTVGHIADKRMVITIVAQTSQCSCLSQVCGHGVESWHVTKLRDRFPVASLIGMQNLSITTLESLEPRMPANTSIYPKKKKLALEVNDSVGEGMDGATQMALIGMKRGWWLKDLWDGQHTHGFPPEKRQQVQASLSTGFPSLGNSPPTQVWSQRKTSLWSAGVYFSFASIRPLKWVSWILASFLFWGRTQSSEGCYPACSGALVPSFFSVLTCEILQSASHCQSGWIVSNYAVLHSATEPGWDLQVHFHMQLKPRLFLGCAAVLKRNRIWRARHME